MSASVLYMSMSLDGFITGPDDGPGQGLGAGGEVLHAWLGDRAGGPSSFDPAGPSGQVFDEVMATFCPTRALVSVDLPTLGRPTNETNPAR